MPLPPLALPSSILAGLDLLASSRYVYASALSWLLWDNAITFEDEVTLIWSQGINSATVVFYLNRYGVPLLLVILQYIGSGLSSGLDLKTCKVLTVVLMIGTVISSALVNGYMAYHYLVLWDRHRRATIAIIVIFFITYIPAATLAIKSAVDYHKFIEYIDMMHACIATQEPPLMKGFWSFLVWFDFCAMIVVILNALNRPHRRTIDAFRSLWGDGVIYFAALLVIRIGNLICVTRLPPQKAILQLFHVWSFISILLSRFIFRVERMKHPRKARVYVWNTDHETFQMRNWSNPHIETP